MRFVTWKIETETDRSGLKEWPLKFPDLVPLDFLFSGKGDVKESAYTAPVAQNVEVHVD